MTPFSWLGAFYCFAKMHGSRRPEVLAAAGGFLAGSAFLSDYYAAITSVCVLGYGLLADRKKALHILLGFAVPIAVLFYYNDRVFGAVWPLSYKYGHLFNQFHSTGFYGITLPGPGHVKRLAAILFARWGFFFTNLPVIFSIYAFRKFYLLRREAYLILFMTAGYLYLNSSLSWFDAYSARFFMPLLPFLILPVAFFDYGDRWMRNIFFFILGFSVMINLVGADIFLPEFVGSEKPGMQNIAAMILAPHGIKPGYGNLILPTVLILFVWIIGQRPRKAVVRLETPEISSAPSNPSAEQTSKGEGTDD